MSSPENLTMDRMTDLLTDLTPAVLKAGEVIMEIHRRGVVARTKSDGSPVSEADEAAEAILLAALAECAPDIAVVSEENAASHTIDPPQAFFLVDPIDGTREFLRADGNGAFTVNIGLVINRRPVFGIVHAPALGRFFAGIVGRGAWETTGGETRAIRVRQVPEDGPLAVASRSHRDPQTNGWLDEHGITNTIATGSSVKFGLLAAGEADVYPRFGPTMEWDTAAGEAVLRAAGGRVACLDGSDFAYGKPEFRNTPFIACAGYDIGAG
jgi:3'(2'), 5'-bisphosphate nucleotidase